MIKKDCAIDGRLSVEQDRTIPPPKNSPRGATGKARRIAAIYGVAIASLLACNGAEGQIVTQDSPFNLTSTAKTVGLILNEREAFGGYTLFNRQRRKTIYLIDNQGLVVHKWEFGADVIFTRLLENGNLLALLNTDRSRRVREVDRSRYVREVDRNGNILSDCTQGRAHHDFLKMPQRECAAVVTAI